MQIFGVGLGELVFIFLIAVIILGPEGMVKTAGTLGKTIRKVIHSPIWTTLMTTQRELREVPTRIVREAGLEEDLKDIQKTSKEIRNMRIDDTTLNKLVPPKKSEPVAVKAAPTVATAAKSVSSEAETKAADKPLDAETHPAPTEEVAKVEPPVAEPPTQTE